MTIDGRLLHRARERLARQKEENIALRERREKEAYAAIPELYRIDTALRGLVGEVLELTAGGRTDSGAALERIQEKSLTLCAEKAELLVAEMLK